MKKAQNLKKEISSMHNKSNSKKNHLHVKKNAKKAARAAKADTKAEMEDRDDSDMDEPIAHEKESNADNLDKTNPSSSKKVVPRDADSTDSTDTLDNETRSQKDKNSHTQKSSTTIDETKTAAKSPKDKKDVKK
jgi:hypothetical protein